MGERFSTPGPVLLVAAVPAELRGTAQVESLEKLEQAGSAWPLVEVSGNVWATVSGVGRANAAGATAAALARGEFAAVINVGIAGSLPGSGLAIGQCVVATECVFVEEGMATSEGSGWRGMEALGFSLMGGRIGKDQRSRNHNSVPTNAALREAILSSCGAGAVGGAVATVACCSGTDAAAAEVKRRTGAIAEAMEGAAVVLAATRMGVRVAEVRVISNTCGERANQTWDLPTAFARLEDVVRGIVRAAG